MLRTHDAGSLSKSDVGTTVVLAGWVARRRDHGGVAFIDLRDASGAVQVVIKDEIAGALRAEWCVLITGTVRIRPEGNENPNIATGAIEIDCQNLEVLSEAAALPFPVDSGDVSNISEEIRLKYRYLDLRREGPARNLRLRSRVTSTIRTVMDRLDFLEIETPYLTRSTPEGARDFLVPVRLQPGSWYALPQSPQLFKQLLMVAGMERYYQIARCFRDEDFRADRQPEFTQLDIEMSFVDQEDILRVAEEILEEVFNKTVGYQIPRPIPRMTYAEAMRRYGSDKPDLRFELELIDVKEFFADTTFRVFQADYV
ncbi:MAG: aspartate--tRNA ligase, partial [Actinomycetes bacterium]